MDERRRKNLPFALLVRYWTLRPRLQSCLRRLRQHTTPEAPANAVERTLVAELIRAARAVTSRDGFGRALRLLPPGQTISRAALLERLEEAETALLAFQALYHGGEEAEADDEEDVFWRVDPDDPVNQGGMALMQQANSPPYPRRRQLC